MGPTGRPETSVRNYHYVLRNSAEECCSTTFRMYNTFCFPTAIMVTRTPLSVTSHVCTLPVLLKEQNDLAGWSEQFQDWVWELRFGAVVWEPRCRAVVWEPRCRAVVWEPRSRAVVSVCVQASSHKPCKAPVSFVTSLCPSVPPHVPARLCEVSYCGLSRKSGEEPQNLVKIGHFTWVCIVDSCRRHFSARQHCKGKQLPLLYCWQLHVGQQQQHKWKALLCLHGDNGYANAPHCLYCFVGRTVAVDTHNIVTADNHHPDKIAFV